MIGARDLFVAVCSRFGPLVNHWTARFEAKHKYFKNLANIMGNYTNNIICYSLSLRHQLHQCYRSLNTLTLDNEKIEVGPGNASLFLLLWLQEYSMLKGSFPHNPPPPPISLLCFFIQV